MCYTHVFAPFQLTCTRAAASKMFEDAFAQVHFVAQVWSCSLHHPLFHSNLSFRWKQAQALADSPDVVVPVQIWTKVDGFVAMLGSCDVPVSSLLTAAASLAGRSTRPRIHKPVLAPMDQWFPVRSPSGSLVGRSRVVCEVVPVSVNHDDVAGPDAGVVPHTAAPSTATVDSDLAAQPSLEVLEVMRARIRTEVSLGACEFRLRARLIHFQQVEHEVSVRMAARLEEFRIKQQQLCDLEQLLRQKLLTLERREAELGIAERAAETQRLQAQQILEARSSELVESKRRIREELSEALKASKVRTFLGALSVSCDTRCRLPRKPVTSGALRQKRDSKTQSCVAKRLRKSTRSTGKISAGARMVEFLQVLHHSLSFFQFLFACSLLYTHLRKCCFKSKTRMFSAAD